MHRPPDNINDMKSKRWARHVEHMAAIRYAYTILIRKYEETKSFGEGEGRQKF